MKSQFLIFFAFLIVGLSCKKDYDFLPANEDGRIYLNKTIFSEEYLKGVIVSNERGDIYFEKVFDEGDRLSDFEMNFKKNKEDIIQVSLVYASVFSDNFRIESYYNIENEIRFNKIIPEEIEYKKMRIRVPGFSVGHPPFFDLNGLNHQRVDGNFEGEDFIVETDLFPAESEVFFVVQAPNDPFKRYFYSSGEADEYELEYQFLPYLTDSFDIKWEGRSLIPFYAGTYLKGKKHPLPMFQNGRSNIFARFFMPTGIEIDSVELQFSDIWGSSYWSRQKEFPKTINTFCQNSVFENPNNPDRFTDIFRSPPEYFVMNRFFPIGSISSGSWSLKGIYKEDFEFVFPKISNEMLEAVPGLLNLENSIIDNIQEFTFHENSLEKLRKNPFLIESLEWRQRTGYLSCVY